MTKQCREPKRPLSALTSGGPRAWPCSVGAVCAWHGALGRGRGPVLASAPAAWGKAPVSAARQEACSGRPVAPAG